MELGDPGKQEDYRLCFSIVVLLLSAAGLGVVDGFVMC